MAARSAARGPRFYDSKGFNPFGSGDDIARMRMLIDMVSMCSQNGLLPGTKNLFDMIKKQFRANVFQTES